MTASTILNLKSQLGLHELFSSMESMKSLISQVTASKRPASEPLVANLAKRSLAAAADESQPTRVASVTDAGSFDPSQPISCTDTTAEAAELDLPSIFDDSDAKGPKVSEVLALRVNEACTKKALDYKLHPLHDRLQLAAWILSANSCRQVDFRHRLLNSSVPHGPKGLRNSTSLYGRLGVAGVIRGTSIPFRVMQSI